MGFSLYTIWKPSFQTYITSFNVKQLSWLWGSRPSISGLWDRRLPCGCSLGYSSLYSDYPPPSPTVWASLSPVFHRTICYPILLSLTCPPERSHSSFLLLLVFQVKHSQNTPFSTVIHTWEWTYNDCLPRPEFSIYLIQYKCFQFHSFTFIYVQFSWQQHNSPSTTCILSIYLLMGTRLTSVLAIMHKAATTMDVQVAL